MSIRHTPSALLLATVLLAPGASAQTPARPAQFILPPSGQSEFLSGGALDGTDNLTFLWWDLNEDVYLGRFSSANVPLGAPVRLDDPRRRTFGDRVVTNQRGDTVVTWTRFPNFGPSAGVLRRTSPVLKTLTLPLKGPADVAVDRAGNFVAVWTVPTPAGTRVFGQRYNADGTPRGPEFNAATSTTGVHVSPSVAMNQATGEFVVVWEVRDAAGNGLGVYGQRFGFTTGRQGSEFPVFVPSASERPGLLRPFVPQVARAEDGRFAVLWRDPGPGDSLEVDILVQRYGNDGAPSGAPVAVNPDRHLPDSRPQIAMSPAGDFAVAWDDGGTSQQWFRLFHRDGTPAGPVISEPGLGGAPYYGTGRVAFGWNGTFVYGWTNYNDEGIFGNTISFQRFSGSPGDEPCLFRNGHFLCDTGHTGGAPEIDHVFAVRGGTPLLGDVDGDGREDYCLFRDTRFDCDSGHDFGAAETTILFGQPGDQPLLGDADGDGRDDACVFRGDRFLCDTAHDGGSAELEIAFGAPGDQGLLGDLDGDGRAEACVYRNFQFSCDTAHDGGAAETVVSFGALGEIPLLGDFDGDGRDDLCAAARGVIRCDTAHDGGSAEAVLTLNGPGRPLLGNLDGL